MNEEFKIALRRLNHLTNNLYTDIQLNEAGSPHVERTIAEMKTLLDQMTWQYFYGKSSDTKIVQLDEDELRGFSHG